VLCVAVAMLYALRILQTGVQQAVDTATYARWADQLIAVDFNIAAYLREQTFVAPPVTYLLWVMVVAALKATLGAWWMTGAVTLNWAALTAGAYATLATVRNTSMSSAGLLLAALLFCVAAELLIFVPYVLSDLLFWAVSTGVLACGVVTVTTTDDDRRRPLPTLAVAGSLLVVAAVMLRPTAVPLVLFWALVLVTSAARSLIDRHAGTLLGLVAVAAIAAIALHSYVLAHPEAWPFGPLPQILVMVADEARQGMFVHNANPPMLVTPATDAVGFARITLQKLAFFITPWLPHYSAVHTMMNVLFFVSTYGLSMSAVNNLQRLDVRQRRAAVLLTSFIVLLAVFHSLLLIDSDHRYRLPMLPALVMLATIGLESVRRQRMLASTGRAK
jgi:hypothetical protein